MRLLILITSKNKSEPIINHIAPLHLLGSFKFMGKGTATNEILDALGLEETNKDVVFSILEDENVQPIFDILEEKFQFTKRGTGVALTVPLNSITSQTLELLKKEINGGVK